MTWNWQLPDWPTFSWDKSLLRKAEDHFLVGAGVFAGTLKHLPQSGREQLTIDVISTEALTTSEIEGEILNRASVQSSIRRQLGLAADKRQIAPAEEGISEMMVNLYQSFAAWHFLHQIRPMRVQPRPLSGWNLRAPVPSLRRLLRHA